MVRNVSAGIFIKNGKILIMQRADGKSLAGYWEFPGGKQENGESILACLEREILEELGVKCKAKEIFTESIYTYDAGAINLVAIIAYLEDHNIKLTVHDDYKWISIKDLLNYKLASADIQIAEKIIKKYAQ